MANVTGEQKTKAREELGTLIVRAGEIISAAQKWQAYGDVEKIFAVN